MSPVLKDASRVFEGAVDEAVAILFEGLRDVNSCQNRFYAAKEFLRTNAARRRGFGHDASATALLELKDKGGHKTITLRWLEPEEEPRRDGEERTDWGPFFRVVAGMEKRPRRGSRALEDKFLAFQCGAQTQMERNRQAAVWESIAAKRLEPEEGGTKTRWGIRFVRLRSGRAIRSSSASPSAERRSAFEAQRF